MYISAWQMMLGQFRVTLPAYATPIPCRSNNLFGTVLSCLTPCATYQARW
jgi:hypothetical protein